MNIFAKVIISTNNDIKNSIISRLYLDPKEEIDNLEIYLKQDEINIVLIYSKDKNFENILNYIKNNYEVIKILNLWDSIALWDLDLTLWDVIIPNTIINEENEAIFFEYIIDNNYDLKNFWLILNWICFTKQTQFKTENEVLDYKENYIAEILDDEAFMLSKELEKNDFLDKSVIIKIVWKDKEFIKNWLDILELML